MDMKRMNKIAIYCRVSGIKESEYDVWSICSKCGRFFNDLLLLEGRRMEGLSSVRHSNQSVKFGITNNDLENMQHTVLLNSFSQQNNLPLFSKR
jgi:hypothetical protein